MEKVRSNLKASAICILALTIFRLAASIVTFAIQGVQVPESMITPEITKDLAKVVMIVAWALSLVFNLPSFYVGIKGLKVAKNPDKSKAHIVWAVIMLVFAIISVLAAVNQLTTATDMVGAILEVVSTACITIVYICYVVEAKKVRAGA